MYIDAHTHLDFYNKNIDKAIDDINKNKILTLANSMDIESYNLNKSYLGKSKYIKVLFGIHPWKAQEFKDDLNMLVPYIEESELIGEIGLDYLWVEDKGTFKRQKEVFYFILDEAIKRNKFVTLHTKDAEEEIYNALKIRNYNRAIIHWYSGNIEILDRFIELGCYFTISVDVGYSRLAEEILKKIPLDKLLLETDGPTALEWVNGVYGYPSEIKRVYEIVAKYKNIELDKFKNIIKGNYYNIIT